MLEAQKSLQRIILENYGGRPIGPGEDAEDSFLLRLESCGGRGRGLEGEDEERAAWRA